MTYTSSSWWVVLVIVTAVLSVLFVALLGVLVYILPRRLQPSTIMTYTTKATIDIYTTMVKRNSNVVVMVAGDDDASSESPHVDDASTTTTTVLLSSSNDSTSHVVIDNNESGRSSTPTAPSHHFYIPLSKYAIWARGQLGMDDIDTTYTASDDGSGAQYESLYTPIRSTPTHGGDDDDDGNGQHSSGILMSSAQTTTTAYNHHNASTRSRVVSCSVTTQAVDAVTVLRNGRYEIEFQAI